MPSDTELSWAAGLFEGEGSIRISKPTKRNWGSLNVDVVNTDQQIIRFFSDRWHGSVHYVGPRGRRKAYWRWRCSALHAAKFLIEIKQFVLTERIKAKIEHGLYFQSQKRHRRSDEQYAEDQWNAYWWMAKLNKRGSAA